MQKTQGWGSLIRAGPWSEPDEVWVVHAFQKKSKQGRKTPQREVELIKDRLKRLKEMLR